VVSLAWNRREKRIHRTPDLVIRIERAAGARDAATHLLRVRIVDLLVPGR
jgi:hypothetical protein